MPVHPKEVSAIGTLVLLSVMGNAIVMKSGLTIHSGWYGLLVITVPLLLYGLYEFRRRRR
jgi:hypothetical protein